MSGTQRYRTAVAAALVLALAVTLAGCSDDEKPRSLPSLTSTSPSPTPSTTDTRGMSDKQQVKAIYKEFNARRYSGQDMSKAKRRNYYKQWAVEPALSQFVDGYEAMRNSNERLYGTPVPHIFSLEVTGQTAVVDDCSDVSNVVRKNTKTGEVISEPLKRSWAVMKLTKIQAGWRIAESDVRDEACDQHS